MNHLAICPQRHVWSPPGSVSVEVGLICPVCGAPGTAAAVVPTESNWNLETLVAANVPPIVDDVTLIVPADALAAEETLEADLPTVPGYDLLRELGRGGMGVVYLARHRELKRLVALKMILAAGQFDRELRDRFHREAQAIARLQQPGIVQIHDVGEHAGCPFLALEFVDGSNLASQIAGTPIVARRAAELIERLARAIHSAHQSGIVHRDLTPRNILLARSSSSQSIRLRDSDTDRFDPKITDFGLAKELDSDSSQTQTGVVMGTPNYMSPEQAQGRSKAIGPATDVHALGAILYELLTGRPPFLAASSLETLRQVVEHDPVAPTRWQPRIPQDLETICLKCLAKESAQRYASAAELADDLHRFLIDEPIRARPVSSRERAVKWARRHPAAAALLGVIAVSLATISIGGVAYNARVRGERDRAEKNFGLAMRAVDEMLSEVGEQQLATEPRMEEKRRALLSKALALNQEFLKQKSDDPRVRFETAQAYRRMADVFRLLEEHGQSRDAYEQAGKLFAQLNNESPQRPVYRQQLAYCRNFQGEVCRAAGQQADAEAAYREADSILESLSAEHPDVPGYRQDLARTLYSLGILFRERQQMEDAERALQRAADILTELVDRDPENSAYRQHLARAWLNQGTVIRSAERRGEAQAAHDRAIKLLSELSETFPDQPDYRHELAVAYNNAGNLRSGGQEFDEARALHDKARTLFQKLSADFPKVPLYRQELANAWNSIGYVESLQQKPADSHAAWTQAAALLEGLVAEHPDVATYQGDLGMVLGNLGLADFALSKPEAAREDLERSVKRLRGAVATNPGHAIYQEFLRDNSRNLAEVLVVSGDHVAAAAAARDLVDLAPDSVQEQYAAACFLARCAALVENDSRLDSDQRPTIARAYADESLAMLRKAIAAGFNDASQLKGDRDSIFQAVAARSDFQALLEKIAPRSTSP